MILEIVLFFILGLAIGSFLNVIIHRLPKNENLLGRSYCDNCKRTLGFLDLFPVFSFIALRGQCRFCKQEIDIRNLIVELATGTLFVLTFIFLNNNAIALFYYLIIISSLIVIFFIDLKYGIIPDRIVYPMIVLSFIYLILSTKYLILPHLLSALGASLFFLLLFFATKGKGMGFGDIKISFLLGLVLGFPKIIISLYLAFLTGAIVGLILILWKKKSRKDAIAFGPYLSLGAIITIFLGDRLVLLLSNFW